MPKRSNGLDEAAHAAGTVRSAIKVGKAVSAAAKGAAVGGPYGAAAGALIGAQKHAGKILIGAAVLLLLPVLFVLMLPSLIFGGLTSSGSQPNQPILNDNDAIIQNTNDIAFTVSQILGEGITDAEARIAQDFAATDGDQYEIVNPYAADMVSNTNAFVAQYCAARDQDWKAISLADMEQILRQGKSHLYSFTRTSETREVEDDDPETEDVVETRSETWYIYTLVYNGEAYFADTIFCLTDDQKALADDYAQNLSVFLGDGMFQYADSVSGIPSLGSIRFTDGATDVVYFNQLDERYADKPYGTDNIGGYACGPTSMAIVVSSLTSETVDPAEMSKWAYENGYWCSKSGSYHTLIPGAAKAWGLPVEGCTASEPQRIVDALSEGKLVVALMTKGHFTKSGHFIVLRGVQDGQILVADPASYSRSQKLWDLSIILSEASKRAGAGGPFWIIG
ncbi:MAG: C39 family peptidase [Dysosmobacter sp.]|nr:C39 family peptidase [Dysosmobacter sp.]